MLIDIDAKLVVPHFCQVTKIFLKDTMMRLKRNEWKRQMVMEWTGLNQDNDKSCKIVSK